MTTGTLALDALLAVVTALLFAYVGEIVRRRSAADDGGRRALRLFAVWWYGLAVVTLLGAVRSALVLAGNRDLATHVVLNDLSVIPLVALLWGLVSYLAFIYTGSARVFFPITILHLAILAFYGYVVASLTPSAVKVDDWMVSLQYVAEPGGWVIVGVLVTVLVPVLAVALAYGTLYFRTEDRIVRYRIGMTSGAFLLWFGSAGVASATPLGQWYWWPLTARVVGLVATLMILAAYKPPAWVRSRLSGGGPGQERGAMAPPRARLLPVARRAWELTRSARTCS